jgi:DNA-binding transcriptional ArsR family regulator
MNTPVLLPPVPPAIDIAALHARAHDAAALLKALAHADRLLLLCHLLGGGRTVGELGAATGIRQPNLSQQLAVLRHEGLVATRRAGKHVHYSVGSPAVEALLQTLHGLYCAAPGAPASTH